jgi:hypothetical protein
MSSFVESQPIQTSPIAEISYVKRLDGQKAESAKRNAETNRTAKPIDMATESLKKSVEAGKIDSAFVGKALSIIGEYLDYKEDPNNKNNPIRHRPGIINLPTNEYMALTSDQYIAIMDAWKAATSIKEKSAVRS